MQNVYFLLVCRQLVTMVYGGIHWSGVSVSGMGESQGGVLQQGPNIPFDCHLSGLIGGVLGGRLGGWVVVGKVGETMCHVTITCIRHFTQLVQSWGSPLCRFWKISLGLGGSYPLCWVGGRRLEFQKPLKSNTFSCVPLLGMTMCTWCPLG